MKLSLRKLLMALIVAIFSLYLFSCNNQKNSPLSGSGKTGTTIATVNGSPVTDEDVRFEIGLLPDELQQMATTGEGLATLIDDVLKKEMLYQEAKKLEIDRSDEYKRRLHDLERRLIVEMLLVQEIEKNSSVTDEEAKQFYEDNKERFVASTPGSKGKEKPVPFEEVKDLIKDRLLQQKQRKAFQDFVESLSKTYKVELKNDAIESAFGISVGDKSTGLENTEGLDTDRSKSGQITNEIKDTEGSQK